MRRRWTWLVCTCICVQLVAHASARADDAWFAPDKGLHFGVSMAIAAGSYGIASPFIEAPRYRAALGFSVAMSAGIIKESWDAAGHGDPSWRDLTWDFLGALTGTAIAWGIDFALKRRTRPKGDELRFPLSGLGHPCAIGAEVPSGRPMLSYR